MYHNTIHINFQNSRSHQEITYFNYSFMISKHPNEKFSTIKYSELLNKFSEIGFNTKYIKFNDVDESENVYCSYNYQSNFNIFFKAYNKLLQYRKFDITLEYGVIINGNFCANNMNTFATAYFHDIVIRTPNQPIDNIFCETIIKGKTHEKIREIYQVVDKDGKPIAVEETDQHKEFKQHFFDRYDVKVALRKYKLGRLKMFSE